MIFKINELVPQRDMIVVRRIDVSKTAAGIFMPGSEKESKLAKVIRVGPDVPKTCKPGMFFVMARFIGEKYDINHVEYNTVKYADCLVEVKFDNMGDLHDPYDEVGTGKFGREAETKEE